MAGILTMFGLDERQRLRKRADRGDAGAAFQLALLLLEKSRKHYRALSDEERDAVKKLLEQSASAGLVDAAFELGKEFREYKWLRHAARSGHLEASVQLAGNAKWLAEFDESEKDEVFRLAAAARDAGHKRAADVLQELYISEFGCTFDPSMYFECLTSAERKSRLIKIRLAWCNTFGIGTRKSPKTADQLFRELHDDVRFEPMSKRDTEEPDLWLYPYDHNLLGHRPDFAVANVAKYMAKCMGGLPSFMVKLEKDDPAAKFLLYLAIHHVQVPSLYFDKQELLNAAAKKKFAPAMFALASTLPFNDPKRQKLMADAGRRGYLPAQMKLAQSSKVRFEKAAWKTVIFAQESFYGFRPDFERQPLDAEMEDFALRGIGYSSRESSNIVLQPSEGVPGEAIEEFYEVLLSIYAKYVKPFKPVSTREMRSAVYNVIGYDDSVLEGRLPGPRLPELP
jgi:hypothetical protein